jgi:hypothetical protein
MITKVSKITHIQVLPVFHAILPEEQIEFKIMFRNKRKNRKLVIRVLTLWLIYLPKILFGQDDNIIIEGSVSYITGQSIYVKFLSTQGIENGDTLFIHQENKMIPILIVTHHSSISCLCNYTGDIKLKLSDQIFAKIRKIENTAETKIEASNPEQDINEQVLKSAIKTNKTKEIKQDIGGSLSLSSYSNLYNNASKNSHRFRYTLSFNADHISNSKLSFESYISFSHKLKEWDVVKGDIFSALKIYSLALNYTFTDKLQMWFGRKINPNIANIGAIDGIQIQYSFGNFYTGIAGGSRPDFSNYSFNSALFEVGGYLGHNFKTAIGTSQSSLAFFEQQNHGNTDRRFLYFQHNNNLLKNLNIFSSVELDLFKLENGLPKSNLNLTGIYLSLRYRLSSKASVFASYDARKNVIYYETFKSYADLIVQNATRQGLRFRINYRPINYLNIGADAGSRFQQNDSRRNITLNGYATYSQLPFIKASLNLSTNLMQTSYLNGEVYGVRLTKDFFNGKFNADANYRLVNFRYVNSESKLLQNIGELNLSWQCNKKLFLSVNFEATFEKNENYNRIYFNIRKKF